MTGEEAKPTCAKNAQVQPAPAEMPGEEAIHALLLKTQRDFQSERDAKLAGQGLWPDRSPAPLNVLAKAVAEYLAPILAEKERLAQVSALMCDGCGWAMRFPDLGCVHCGFHRAEARALAAEAALAAAIEALQPFADEKNGAMQDILWGDQPDSATMTITCPLGHVRKAREVVRAAAIRAQGE